MVCIEVRSSFGCWPSPDFGTFVCNHCSVSSKIVANQFASHNQRCKPFVSNSTSFLIAQGLQNPPGLDREKVIPPCTTYDGMFVNFSVSSDRRPTFSLRPAWSLCTLAVLCVV